MMVIMGHSGADPGSFEGGGQTDMNIFLIKLCKVK